jgi:hypothetical protein
MASFYTFWWPFHRVFLMHFNQVALVVINLLPEVERGFVRVHFLQVMSQPAQAARHIEPVTPSTVGQLIPVAKFLLVLRTGAPFDVSSTS